MTDRFGDIGFANDIATGKGNEVGNEGIISSQQFRMTDSGLIENQLVPIAGDFDFFSALLQPHLLQTPGLSGTSQREC